MATARAGNKIVLYFRDFSKRNVEGMRLAFQTTHTLSGEGDADTTATKDGSVSVGSAFAWTLSVENLASEVEIRNIIRDVAQKTGTMEIWEVDFSQAGTAKGSYKGKYMRGSVTSIEYANDADASAADTAEFAITGDPQDGDVTIDPESAAEIQYAFEDIKAVSAP